MAGNTGAGAVAVTADAGCAAADGGSRIQFKGSAFQISEMTILQDRSVMADRTAVSPANMLGMHAR